ncbi:RloB-like protein [Azotobacter beijerinckii]|uniref:RloB-like protein n=1 Tax=Azotobacter beijerinckii TaxID=170623 RepID=A0A1H9TBE9_9GAMM|nr:RloB family protein [Azotobacter beijerinckii]SER94481.1 RloB-like protein [Azotobacter beijerinckii]
MGSDDLHHRRKAKRMRDLQRRPPVRLGCDKILIVCEGSKTEPFYFEELKDFYEIESAKVRVSGECGSDPMSVVRHGERLYRESLHDCEGAFDKVYCVFDRDQHPNYQEALFYLSKLRPLNVFEAITSVPCFEVWLLLHFNYSSAPFVGAGGKSAGDQVVSVLKDYWPDYEKGSRGSFVHVFGQVGQAKRFAERLIGDAERNGSDNPTTKVHKLVSTLQEVKQK